MFRRLSVPLALLSALVVSGCVQTTADLTNPPAATGDPLVLNTAPATPEAGVATASGSATTPTAEPATAVTPATTPAPPVTVPTPQVATTPAPVTTTPVPAAATALQPGEPTPAAVPQTIDGYPNLNARPPEPGGVVLPPEERARIITELEALRAGQGGAGGGSVGPSVAGEAETHGERALQQIEKCSEQGAAEKYPECAPTN